MPKRKYEVCGTDDLGDVQGIAHPASEQGMSRLSIPEAQRDDFYEEVANDAMQLSSASEASI